MTLIDFWAEIYSEGVGYFVWKILAVRSFVRDLRTRIYSRLVEVFPDTLVQIELRNTTMKTNVKYHGFCIEEYLKDLSFQRIPLAAQKFHHLFIDGAKTQNFFCHHIKSSEENSHLINTQKYQ